MTTFSKLTLTEYPSPSTTNIWRHPAICEQQRLNIKNYCDAIKTDANGACTVEVEYIMKAEFGRLFLKDPSTYSCVAMWNAIRSSMFANTEYDIDIVNCHCNLLLSICDDKIDCDNLKYYCENREKVIADITINQNAIDVYNDTNNDNKDKKDIVKTLFTILLYGGVVKTWAELYGLKEDDYKLTAFADEFINELKELVKIVAGLKKYQKIKAQVFKKEKVKAKALNDYNNLHKKDKRKKDIVFDDDKFEVNPFKVLSVILQDMERLIILKCFDYLKGLGVVITSYNYDGFQVTKKSFDIDLIHKLNVFIQEENKYVKFIIKLFKIGLDLSVIPEPSPVLNIQEFNHIENYSYKKYYFENFVAFVESPSMFVVMDKNGDVIDKLTANRFSMNYKKFQYKSDIGELKSFTTEWTLDSNQRSYAKYVYLPTPLKAASYEFNAWNGWAIERQLPSKIPVSTQLIEDHIRLMSGLSKTEEVYEYLLNWFAWIVQFPAMKTMICIILYGKQRIGKSCVAENLMRTICGEDKLFITASVDNLFGKFANNVGKHVVVLNEANGKDTFNIQETIKDAISRETQMLETKGVDAVKVNDYANYMLTTNNINSANTPEDDGRFMPIHCNESRRGDKQYFINVRAAFDDPIIMKAFYDKLMARDLSNWNAEKDRPETDLRTDMKELNKTPIVEFVEFLHEEVLGNMDYDDKNTCYTIPANDLYNLFKRCWTSKGRKGDSMYTQTKFGVMFKRLDNVVRTHTMNGNVYKLFIPKINYE